MTSDKPTVGIMANNSLTLPQWLTLGLLVSIFAAGASWGAASYRLADVDRRVDQIRVDVDTLMVDVKTARMASCITAAVLATSDVRFSAVMSACGLR